MNSFDKDVFIDNIELIPAQQIAEFISKGLISDYELVKKAGTRYDMTKRKEVLEIINSGVSSTPVTTDVPPVPPVPPLQRDETIPDYEVAEAPQVVQEAQVAQESQVESVEEPSYFSFSGWDEARVSSASAEEIADVIREGEVSSQYLIDNFGAAYAQSKRRQVKLILTQSDREDFAQAEQENTVEAFETYLASHPQGEQTEQAKAKIAELKDLAQKAQQKQIIDTAWQRVDKQSSQEIRRFLQDYPDSYYEHEANQLLAEITNRKRRGYINPTEELEELDYFLERTSDAEEEISTFYRDSRLTTEDVLKEIAKNPNILQAKAIKYLIEYGGISFEDLIECGLSQEVVQYVDRLSAAELEKLQIETLGKESYLTVDRACREIYIWGVPSSGKTCAIGAILHTLFRATDDYTAELINNENNKDGYDYASQLRNAFNPHTKDRSNLIRLVKGTDLNQFYKIEFDITKRTGKKSKQIYPYTLMDMAGELMAAIHRNSTGHTSYEDDIMLGKLDEMLGDKSNSRRGNRRIHIFCLEYGGENKRITKDDPTDVQTYLESVGNYLRQKNYLRNDTDAIYVLLTKVDRNHGDVDLETYINEHYSNFINFLKGQCQDYDINGGSLICQLFSLGEVYLQTLCKLDTSYAQDFIQKILIEQGQSFTEGGLLNRIKKALRS